MKLETCIYSGYKIHPGHGKRVVRPDGKQFLLRETKLRTSDVNSGSRLLKQQKMPIKLLELLSRLLIRRRKLLLRSRKSLSLLKLLLLVWVENVKIICKLFVITNKSFGGGIGGDFFVEEKLAAIINNVRYVKFRQYFFIYSNDANLADIRCLFCRDVEIVVDWIYDQLQINHLMLDVFTSEKVWGTKLLVRSAYVLGRACSFIARRDGTSYQSRVYFVKRIADILLNLLNAMQYALYLGLDAPRFID
uniref:DALR_1 domain-containing protein n=1 Tax=Heterorhabditis bacteriophora TaxID=37862 RepID=A0A1I7W6E9_HETBA